MTIAAMLTIAALSGVAGAETGPGPSLTGSVEGGFGRGESVVFRLRAEHPEGHEALTKLQVTMSLHDLVLAQVTFDPRAGTMHVRGGFPVEVGTSGIVSGSFFEFSGLDVETHAEDRSLDLAIKAKVREDIPDGAMFRLSAEDGDGRIAAVTGAVVAIEPPAAAEPSVGGDGGLSWSSLAVAVLAALFLGTFVGNLFASKRRAESKVSVYSAISRRIRDEERPT